MTPNLCPHTPPRVQVVLVVIVIKVIHGVKVIHVIHQLSASQVYTLKLCPNGLPQVECG